MEALADHFTAFADVWQGEPERALERQRASLERALKLGAGSVVPMAHLRRRVRRAGAGRPEQARDRLEGMLPLVEGRDAFATSWALCLLAEARAPAGGRRRRGHRTARPRRAPSGLGNRLFATRARLTLGRLAAARGEWAVAQQHALAHLDACAEGGHTTYVPACLDALAEVAGGAPALRRGRGAAVRRRRARPGRDRHRPRPAGGAALGRDRPPAARRAAPTGHTRPRAPRAPS